MKMFNKTLLAAALLASAGAANATLVNNAGMGNELFLSVYDPNAVNADLSKGRTYNLDLNVTFASIKANAGTALAAFQGAGYNLAADALWNTFASGITNPSAVKYVLAVGSSADQSIAITGVNAIQPNVDTTVTLTAAANFISSHANQINVGLAGANSSLIKDNAPVLTGQMNNPGLVASTVWTGWSTHNPLQSYGSSVDFWLGGFHTETVNDPIFGAIPQDMFTASDVSKLGSFNLSGNILTFALPQVAAVPLPAAVWLFGAGLMGVLRTSRRKAA